MIVIYCSCLVEHFIPDFVSGNLTVEPKFADVDLRCDRVNAVRSV